jgi:hypothetical protein
MVNRRRPGLPTPGLLLLLAIALVGCRQPDVQAIGDRLAEQLKDDFQTQIVAIAFENSPPLDPPTLWIDLSPSLDLEAQRRFVCDVVWPRVTAEAGMSITTITTVGPADEICAPGQSPP